MIKWNEKYNIGVREIDEEHQRLVGYLNDFMQACQQQKATEKIKETLKLLKSYTQEHFCHEEDLMVRVEYSEIAEHRKQHEEFMEVIEYLDEQVEKSGVSVLTTIKLNRLLVDWLLKHIQGKDFSIACHIHQRNHIA